MEELLFAQDEALCKRRSLPFVQEQSLVLVEEDALLLGQENVALTPRNVCSFTRRRDRVLTETAPNFESDLPW